MSCWCSWSPIHSGMCWPWSNTCNCQMELTRWQWRYLLCVKLLCWYLNLYASAAITSYKLEMEDEDTVSLCTDAKPLMHCPLECLEPFIWSNKWCIHPLKYHMCYLKHCYQFVWNIRFEVRVEWHVRCVIFIMWLSLRAVYFIEKKQQCFKCFIVF